MMAPLRLLAIIAGLIFAAATCAGQGRADPAGEYPAAMRDLHRGNAEAVETTRSALLPA